MRTITLTAILISFVGCGHKDGSSPNVATPSVPSLLGIWRTECDNSQITKITFEGSKGQLSIYMFADNQCQIPRLVVNDYASYVTSGNKIDYTIESTNLTLFTQEEVDNCNNIKCYGLDDWSVNATKNISGLIQNGETAAKAGAKLYNIFKIEKGVLYFGIKDASSPELRPTTFSQIKFSKVLT